MSFNVRPSSSFMGNVAKNASASMPISAPTPPSTTSNAFKGAFTGAFTSASSVFDGAKGKLSSMLSGKSGIIALIVFFILLFVAVIIFLAKEIRGNKYETGKMLTTDIVKLAEMDIPIEILGSEMKPHKPREFSYSFWMYVDGVVQTPGFGKIVFFRGERDSLQQANPIIMMDEITNQLHFVVRTENSTLASTDNSIDFRKLKPILERNFFLNKDIKVNDMNANKHLVLTVNSVPRQTWMHYALVIKNNIITIYQNGEIYMVKTVNDFIKSKPVEYNQKGEVVPYDLSIDQTSGSVYIGRNSSIGGKNAVNGYLSKLEYFTYALSVNDVYNVYKKGPIPSSLLQKVGITNYGLRSPLFKLNAQV